METTSLPPDDRPPEAGPRRANRGLVWAAALAVVVLAIATVVAFVGGGDDDAAPGTEQIAPNGIPTADDSLRGDDVTGDELPELTYRSFDGEDLVLEPRDKPLLVNFWASTCAPCLYEMPDLERAYVANRATVDFLGLQVAERAESGLSMIEKTGITYPTARDPRAEVFRALGGVGLPRTVIVGTDGRITFAESGALTEAELQAAIDESLAS